MEDWKDNGTEDISVKKLLGELKKVMLLKRKWVLLPRWRMGQWPSFKVKNWGYKKRYVWQKKVSQVGETFGKEKVTKSTYVKHLTLHTGLKFTVRHHRLSVQREFPEDDI